jgi:hypothetical protein
VTQKNDTFKRGQWTHHHPPIASATTKIKLQADIKKLAKENPFTPATAVVSKVMKDQLDLKAPICDFPKLPSLVNIICKNKK